MGTWAQMKIHENNDAIFLQTSNDGYQSFVIPKVYQTEEKIAKTITSIGNVIKDMDDTPESGMLFQMAESLKRFLAQPMTAAKMANLIIWERLNTFYPTTSSMSVIKNDPSCHWEEEVDYHLTKINGKFEVDILSETEREKEYTKGQLETFKELYHLTVNSPVGKKRKPTSIENYPIIPIADNCSIIKVISGKDGEEITYSASEGNPDYTLKINDVPYSTGDFIKMKSLDMELFAKIIVDLPFKIASLFNFWCIGLDLLKEEKKDENVHTKLKNETLGDVKEVISFLSNFLYADSKNINDQLKFHNFKNFGSMFLDSYNLFNYLILFHPDLFETPTVGELRYILKNEPDISALVHVEDSTINLAINGVGDQEMEELHQILDEEAVRKFLYFAQKWNVEPLIAEDKYLNEFENINAVNNEALLKLTGNLSSHPEDQSNLFISYNSTIANYQLMRMFDTSCMQKYNLLD